MRFKRFFFTALLATLAVSASVHAMPVTGDVTGGGTFSGDVDANDAWLTESATGNGVDFWTLTGSPGETLSVSVSGDTTMGVSLYRGEVASFSDALAFSNNGDFADLAYVDGNNPFYGPFEFLKTDLADGAVYTLALGGVGDGFQTGGSFSYEMSVSQVPETSALFLMAGGLSLLVACGVVRPGRKPELA
ncbi:hypothetical protein [Vreelandella utahensis]|uniref:hypothetical protein n=1 Tax=Vreelandella halophila TaxID=86177 RepID=UPI0009869A58|nr:hypothetical protein [Halomonas utahensis]